MKKDDLSWYENGHFTQEKLIWSTYYSELCKISQTNYLCRPGSDFHYGVIFDTFNEIQNLTEFLIRLFWLARSAFRGTNSVLCFSKCSSGAIWNNYELIVKEYYYVPSDHKCWTMN